MEKVGQQELPTSLESKDAGTISAPKEHNKKLVNICDNKSNSADITNAVTERNVPLKIVRHLEDIEIIVNDSSKTSEKNDQENPNDTESSSEQSSVEKKNAESSSALEKEKVLTNEVVHTTPVKVGTIQRRRKRSLSALEPESPLEESTSKSKRRRVKNTSDKFCWRCHKEYVDAYCTACPRSWHRKCIGSVQPTMPVQNWICGECAAILRAENAETRSTAMAQLSVDQLCLLLRYVVDRMREYPGSEPFWKPVDDSDAPNYLDYIVKPMDLGLLESNVRAKLYGSTDAFMADAKWIQHNCIVFNTCGGVYADTSKLTNAAKQIIKLARQEVAEIEACPDCFAHGRNIPRPQPSWFIEPCRRPHPLVWAKLKGFPFWPAKAMPRLNTQGFVDVRFFGQHDRAWVPPRDMFLYSEDPPVPLPRKRKMDMDECVREITRHCRKLELVFGKFQFAPPRVQYNPNNPMQIKLMLPNYDPLQPNNVISPLSSTSKRKIPVRKRVSLSKTKIQGTSESTHSNNSTMIDGDTSAESIDKTLKTTGAKVEACSNSSDTKQNIDETIELKDETKMLKKDDDKMRKSKLALNDNKAVELVSEVKVKTNETSIQLDEKNSKTDDVGSTSNEQEGDQLEKADVKSNLNTDANDISLSALKNTTKKPNTEEPLQKLRKTERDSDVSTTPKILPGKSSEDTTEKKKVLPLKSEITDKVHAGEGVATTQKQGFKITRTLTKVYKPKTRMVDKVNAEKALNSIPANEGKKLNSENVATKLTPVRNGSELKNIIGKSNNEPSTITSVSLNTSKMQSTEASPLSQAVTVTPKSTADQSVALLLVVNSGVAEPLKQSPVDKDRSSDMVASPQLSKDTVHIAPMQKKESRAKKSFPNKPRSYVQIAARPTPSAPSSSHEPMLYIPTHQVENSNPYQLIPPEAGPLSARLYNGAQELTRKISQLMEEAYKEAAQETQCPDGGSSDNHQATVHFLKLQIERMRWQHQQQLAELKHNTDRILREMRSSLEAERMRAVEETRKEAELEKRRCIEETKRKQWCVVCGHEARFYCCSNIAYCDYPCQQSHWSTHQMICVQQPSQEPANTNQQQVMPRLMINTQHVTSNVWRA